MTDLSQLKDLLELGLPIWIVAGGGLLCLLMEALFLKKSHLPIFILASFTLLAALVVTFLRWQAGDFGSQSLLLSDALTQFFFVLIFMISILSLFNFYSYIRVSLPSGETKPGLLSASTISLILFIVVGMCFLVASDHLIVNFIGLETMSLGIYVLVGSNKKDMHSNEAAMKYFILGSVASAIFLYGVALLYSSFGTFYLSQMSQINVNGLHAILPQIALLFIIVSFLFKLAIMPFHFWVPDVYEGAPTPVTGFMATAVKVSLFALFIRFLTSLQIFQTEDMMFLLKVLVVLTLVGGNILALKQDNIKRILAYSSIVHAGYLFLAVAVGLQHQGFHKGLLSSVLFYLMAYSFMTLGAFAVLSVMVKGRKEVTQMSDLSGLGKSRPVLAFFFTLFLISLLGIPPTVGFMAKYNIIAQVIAQGDIVMAVIALLATLISAYYYLKPIAFMYFSDEETNDSISFVPAPLLFVLIFCALSVLYIGLQAEDYLNIAASIVSLK